MSDQKELIAKFLQGDVMFSLYLVNDILHT